VSTTDSPTSAPAGQHRSRVLNRLYTGTGAFDIVGKRKRFYIFFAVLVLVCLASMVFRGFSFGMDFTGGTRIQMPTQGATGAISTQQVESAYTKAIGGPPEAVQSVGTGAASSIQIRSKTLNNQQIGTLKDTLFTQLQPKDTSGKPNQQVISDSAVSASWGGEITRQALIALAVFLVLVTAFIAFYFEKWMAVAALVALVHDVFVTAGVYSIAGFEVTPATVIGLLTILGFSLYDTVVVFDKVKENTRGLLSLTRRTYAEAANLALNQTLMRSINTSLIALLPVLGLLVVGVGLLGVGTLQDLALVQLTGLLAGTLSSIFLATPLLVDLKMREPAYQQQAQRVQNRRANLARRSSAQGESAEGAESTDDEALSADLRRERALAAAASTPSRTGKSGDSRKGRASGRTQRPTGKRRR
jgi:preprotein translocase subunit SecF